MSTKCSMIPSTNYNLVVPCDPYSPIFKSDKPVLILNASFLGIDDIVSEISFWRTTLHSDYVDIRGSVSFHNISKYRFTFSYNINLHFIQKELSSNIRTIYSQLKNIKFDNISLINTYIERSQINNLAKLASVFDEEEYNKFELDEKYNGLNVNSLKFRIEYNINKNSFKFYETNIPNTSRYYTSKPFIHFNGMDFLNIANNYRPYGTREVTYHHYLRMIKYLLSKFGNEKKYNNFLSGFEKRLLV